MSNTFDYSNSTALITGASSGIGASMAEGLAQRGCSIILSARDAAKLEARAAQLRQAYNVNVAVVTADLSQPNGALDLHAEIVRHGLAVDGDGSTRDVRHLVGCNKHDGLGDLFGSPYAFERYSRDQGRPSVFRSDESHGKQCRTIFRVASFCSSPSRIGRPRLP
jgi:short chain dehydrogenase